MQQAEKSTLKGLAHKPEDYSVVHDSRVALCVAEWNESITFALRDGALARLADLGWGENKVEIHYVPGAFELTLGAKWLAERRDIEAVICLGCIIQGDTRHFEFIADAVAQGLTNLSLVAGKPIVFGVLTTDTFTQAEERAGGAMGNKGDEAAITLARMLKMHHQMLNQPRTSIGF
jgi:6,7-dimethyl-8-ribityllumazine synthase